MGLKTIQLKKERKNKEKTKERKKKRKKERKKEKLRKIGTAFINNSSGLTINLQIIAVSWFDLK